MIADLLIFSFVIILCSFFGIVVWLIDDYSARRREKEIRKQERKQRRAERREFERQVYQSEITLALHKADCALRGLK